jgi:hypothetical protein
MDPQKERGGKPTGRYGELRLHKRDGSPEIDREALDKPDDYKAAFNRLLDRNPSVTDVIIFYQPNWSGLNDFLNTTWKELVVSDVESYLDEELKASVSSSDFENFRQHGLEIPNENSRRTVANAIDEIILQAAVEQGPNIFLVPVVRQRLVDWALKERGGSERWEELGKRFALLARVVQGGAKVPLYPWWVRSRRDVVREVKALTRNFHPRVTHRNLSKEELLNEVQYTVQVHHQKFPKLLRIGVPFLLFVQSEAGAFQQLLDETLSPANFTDELIAWMTNYEPESARQIISRYLTSPRKKRS